MRSCEAIYGPEQAEMIEELVVASTGQACPCRRGAPCPLLDGQGCNPLAERVAPSGRDVANRDLAEAVAAAQRAP